MPIDFQLLAERMRAKREQMITGEIPMGQEFQFNPMAYEMQTALEKMPTGWYRAIASAAELVAADYGMGLSVSFKIIDGPYKDRVVKKHFNVRHTSAQTMEIAQREVATLQGCMNLWSGTANTDQMLGIPLQIRLTEKKDSDYNDIKGYKTIDGNDPVKPGTGAAMTVAAAGAPVMATLAAPATPGAAGVDPFVRAQADGWVQHPQSPAHAYKGQDVKTLDEVRALYAAPPAPAAPALPAHTPAASFTPPQQPGAAPAAPGGAAAPVWTPGTPGAPAPPVWKP